MVTAYLFSTTDEGAMAQHRDGSLHQTLCLLPTELLPNLSSGGTQQSLLNPMQPNAHALLQKVYTILLK